MKPLRGIVPIIACPFKNDDEVDYESLRHEIRHLASIGCSGLTLFGIAGEYYKLNDQEQEQMIDVMVEECHKAGIISVISITQHSTYAAIRRAKYTQATGADMLMFLPPFFLKPSGNDLYEHMKAVCQAVDIPVIVQYAPEQTGVSITPSVFQHLIKDAPNACYFKIECKPAGPYITSFLDLTQEENPSVLVGNAGYQMIEAMDRGAIGVMPGASMAEIYLKAYKAYAAGDKAAAIEIHNRLLPILNHIRQNVEMIIFYEKRILAKRGIIATDRCRTPGFTADAHMNELFELYYEQIKDLL